MAIVKCPYCEKQFDREKEPSVLVGNRWYHEKCLRAKQLDDKYKEKIHQKAKELFGASYSKARINKQLKTFTEDGMTLYGIYKSIYYWFDIKKNSISQANGGFGIVPYIYEDVRKIIEQERMREKSLNKLGQNVFQEIEERNKLYQPQRCRVPTNVRPPRRKGFFDLE